MLGYPCDKRHQGVADGEVQIVGRGIVYEVCPLVVELQQGVALFPGLKLYLTELPGQEPVFLSDIGQLDLQVFYQLAVGHLLLIVGAVYLLDHRLVHWYGVTDGVYLHRHVRVCELHLQAAHVVTELPVMLERDEEGCKGDAEGASEAFGHPVVVVELVHSLILS